MDVNFAYKRGALFQEECNDPRMLQFVGHKRGMGGGDSQRLWAAPRYVNI